MAVFMACGNGEERAEQPAGETDESPGETEPVEETEVIDTEEETEMTQEEMTAWVMENCICPQCPSWIPEAAEKGEGGYCAVGVSECIVDEVGCICPDCPVTEEKGLEWGYYCTRGSAEVQRTAGQE
jgi:hypothetical protein